MSEPNQWTTRSNTSNTSKKDDEDELPNWEDFDEDSIYSQPPPNYSKVERKNHTNNLASSVNFAGVFLDASSFNEWVERQL